jgi:hypothetical protein
MWSDTRVFVVVVHILAASISSTAGQACSSVCYQGYLEAVGVAATTSTQQGSPVQYTETSCVGSCSNSNTCDGADWNKQTSTCYYITSSTTVSNSAYDHWSYVYSSCNSFSPSCTTVAIQTIGLSASGLTQQSGSYTEQTCVAACSTAPNCVVVNFNFNTATCYFGFTANPSSTNTVGVNQWILTSCAGTTTNGTCLYNYTLTPNVQSLGLAQLGTPGQYTEQTCVGACNANTSCNVVDYNKATSTCYIGSNATAATQPNSQVDHWSYSSCSSGSATNNSCLYGYSLTANVQAQGLAQLGTPGQYTEQTCVNACSGNSSCNVVDYNRATSTCYIGGNSSLPTNPNTQVDHWVYTACSLSTTSSTCISGFSLYAGAQQLGLAQLGTAGQYTEQTCVGACTGNVSCNVVDYNKATSTCYIGGNGTAATIPNSQVDHWNYTGCGGTSSSTNCINGYSLTAGSQSLGLTQFGSPNQYTEQTCVTTCDGIASCLVCDYNKATNTCYTGTNSSIAITTNSQVDHWNLTGCTASSSSSCYSFFSLAAGMQSQGLTQLGTPGQYTEQTCVSTCYTTPTCTVVDYNLATSTCYTGTNVGIATFSNAQIDHWTYTGCTGSGGTGVTGATGVTGTGIAGCTTGTTETVNVQALGLTQQGTPGQYTETTCVSYCTSNPSTCSVVDWNKATSTCYIGNNASVATQPNSNVDHWIVTSSCSVSGSCISGYSLTANVQSLGLTQNGSPGQYTEQSCVTACNNDAGCYVCDWNKATSTCYFGTTASISTNSNPNVDHWNYTGCSGTGATGVTGATGIAGCTTGTTETVNVQSFGLTQQGTPGQYTESTCVSYCTSNPSTCSVVDWNKATSTCYVGNNASIATQPNTNVDHWIVTSSCSASGSCISGYSLTANVQSLGLTQAGSPGQYTEQSCVTACNNNNTCYVCDWNKATSTCYFGTNANIATTSNPNVDHWNLTGCVGGNGVTGISGSGATSFGSGFPSTNGSCYFTFTLYTNIQAQGLTQFGSPGQYTEQACVTACYNNVSCNAADYNRATSTCYTGPSITLPTNANTQVDHWIDNSCGSSG